MILIHFKNVPFFGVFLDISRRFPGILRSAATLMPENAALYLKNASEFIGHFIKELVLSAFHVRFSAVYAKILTVCENILQKKKSVI